MQEDQDSPQTDESVGIQFDEYGTQRSWWGFNPLAHGYQNAARPRRLLIAALCFLMGFAIVSLWLCQRLPAWQALPGIIILAMLLAIAEWRWRHSRFCPACGVRTKSPRAARAFVWCPVCHTLCEPAEITHEPARQLDITSVNLRSLDPVLEFLYLVLLSGIRDHAQVIRFEPTEHAYEIGYEIQGTNYELVPPPRWLDVPVAEAVKVIVGLDLATRRQREEGRIDILCGGYNVPADVVVESTECGPKVKLRFLTEYWRPAHSDN